MECGLAPSHSPWDPQCQAHHGCSAKVWVKLDSPRAPEAAEPWPGVLVGLRVLDKMSVYLDELVLYMYPGTF